MDIKLNITQVEGDEYILQVLANGDITVSTGVIIYTDDGGRNGVAVFPDSRGGIHWTPQSRVTWPDGNHINMSDVFAEILARGLAEERPANEYVLNKEPSNRIGVHHDDDGTSTVMKKVKS